MLYPTCSPTTITKAATISPLVGDKNLTVTPDKTGRKNPIPPFRRDYRPTKMAIVNHSMTPALKTNPKFIFFTDFDGTITKQDSNDFMIEKFGIGPVVRKEMFQDILFGRRTFRDAFKEMLDSISLPLDQCIKALLQNITLDEGFKEFYSWARENNIPVVVLSGGMELIIRALLAHLLGEDEVKMLPILSNDVAPRPGKTINDEGGWEIVYRDDR